MSYAIFRVEPINKLNALSQIGAHNTRTKQAYKSNPDIDMSKSQNNIDIVPLSHNNYYNSYMNLVKDYKNQHNKRQETIREDRKKSFNQMLDDSNSVVADEMIFTSDNDFFKDMDEEEVKRWANANMDFVYNDIGYEPWQVLNATVHMDEKTPHLHCVVVPLIKKYDKRSNMEKWTISKKHYMKDKMYLSQLQDKYHAKMLSYGYDLDRGIKNSDNEHINLKEYKKITRKLNHELNLKNDKLNKSLEDLELKTKSNKETLFDKEYVKIKKDTFKSMEQVIKDTKKVMEMQPKIQKVYKEINDYTKSYRMLEKEKDNVQKEVYMLEYRNRQLEKENKRLEDYIKLIIERIKEFFKELLHINNEKTKEAVTSQIKTCYEENLFDKSDVKDVSYNTSREYEMDEYLDRNRKEKDDFDMNI